MTTPDPSREAFEKWIAGEYGEIVSLDRRAGGRYEDPEAGCCWLGWQAAMAHCASSIPADAITVNLVRHVGLDKHVARECEQIVRQLLQPAAPKQEGST